MDHIRTPKVENVRLLDRFNTRKPVVGTLYLTATHLIFVDPSGKKETWILHMHINDVEKQPLTTAGSPLLVRCKTFLCVTFILPRERDCHDIYVSLLKLSKPASLDELYAFQYQSPDRIEKTHGWDMYDVQGEYMRMGIPNDLWVHSKINREYEICDTYSRNLYVPAAAATPILVGSSKFRSRGRLPVLSYYHKENQASITRCSQPLAGFSARCVEDEQMLQCILRANPNSKYMFVVDTRPKINAMANRAAGKGYENESFYTNIKFQFLGIENIHVMRNALQKLMDVCELKNPSMNAFLSGLENSGWLKHVKAIMDTSAFIANAIANGISVLVHCSDGWDRTAQTCSLASLMLDPYYRTVQGFQALIEKEWLSFGHKFLDRCGFLETVDNKEVSPVFTQFLDCVWQLTQQFPEAFQFSERYLLTLHDHIYSCQFGTFIGNCEKDRLDLRLRERTYSLWPHLLRNASNFTNPFYNKDYEQDNPILKPALNPQSFKFWRGLYNRFETGIHPREDMGDIISAVKDHTLSLDEHAKLLEKRISSLCRLLGKPEEDVRHTLPTMDSMDFAAIMNSASQKAILNDSKNLYHHNDSNNSIDCDSSSRHSDSESGFEDTSSQMSKSMNEDMSNSLLTPGLVSRSSNMENPNVDQLIAEMKSVAVDWKSFRNIAQCSCSTPFEHFTKKYHCWKCGNVFCTRCIAHHISLPGHFSQHSVPVCKTCFTDVQINSPVSTNSHQVSSVQS